VIKYCLFSCSNDRLPSLGKENSQVEILTKKGADKNRKSYNKQWQGEHLLFAIAYRSEDRKVICLLGGQE